MAGGVAVVTALGKLTASEIVGGTEEDDEDIEVAVAGGKLINQIGTV